MARATPMLIGHRGAPRERPENTLPSFLRALELQADGIELDVHCTSDRVVVVHHDEIPRATPPSGRLAGKRIGLPRSSVRIGEGVVLVDVVILYEISLKRTSERFLDN